MYEFYGRVNYYLTLKVNKCEKYAAGMVIGIANDAHVSQDSDFANKHETEILYCLCNSGNCSRKVDGARIGRGENVKIGSKFGQGDTVIFTLDLCNKEIKAAVNDEESKLLFKNVLHAIDINYRIIFQFWYFGDSISILHSSIVKK